MKILIQIILILLLMLIIITKMSLISYAKYTFDHTINAAEVKIEKVV